MLQVKEKHFEIRDLLNHSLIEGKARKKKETQWVHYCYEGEGDTTIPIYENSCFILALFRSKKVEAMLEAKKRLDHLLDFQVSSGLFPTYLHEFPRATHRHLAIHLLVPFFWIQTHFKNILEKPLLEKFEKSLEKLYAFCIDAEKERPFPPSLTVKLRAFEGHFNIKATPPTSLIDWENWILAAQMVGKEDCHLVQTCLRGWHLQFETAIFEGAQVFQEGPFPAITLFDLLMCIYLKKRPSHRFFNDRHIAFLRAAVIFPSDTLFYEEKSPPYSLTISNQSDAKGKKGFHLFRLLWSFSNSPHSLVCQSAEVCTIYEGFEKNHYVLNYKNSAFKESDQEEVYFYLDETATLLVDGDKSTLFTLGNTLSIQTEKQTIQLQFYLLEGEGTFCGHIGLGDRPCQLKKERFKSFDKEITLRTIRRSSQLKIGFQLDILQ